MGLLDGIRAATQEPHKRLHEHPITSPLVASELALAHYRLVIAAFEGFYTALALQTPATYIDCLSLPALKKDAMALGIPTPSLPPCTLPTIINSTSSALGMLYVIEGSRLGGLMIAKNVRETLMLNESSGLAFFSGRGKNTAPQWKSFLHRLTHECDDTERCITAAEQTFLLLEQWLWTVWNERKSEITRMTKRRELA